MTETGAADAPREAGGRTLGERAYRLRYADAARAADLAQKVLDTCDPVGDPLGYARALLVRGIYLNRVRDYGAAKKVLSEARDVAPADAPFYGELLVVLGQSLVFSSAPKEGLEPLHSAYETFAQDACQLGDTERTVWQGKAAFYLGAAYHGVGDYASALQWFLTALTHDETVGFETFDRYFYQKQSERLPLTGNIAIIYDSIGEYDNAFSYYDLLLDEARQGGHRETEMVTLYNLGVCSERQGHHERALGYFEQAVALGTDLGLAGTTADAWQCVAGIYLDTGRHADAEAALERAHTILAPIRDDHARPYALTLMKLGRLRLEQQRPHEAARAFHDALAVLEQQSILPEIAVKLHGKLADVYERTGELSSALAHLRDAYQRDIDYHQKAYNEKMQTLLVTFDVEKTRQDKEIYRLKNVELEREITERRRAEAALAQKVAELEAAHQQLQDQARNFQRLSERDGLTGLYNRRMLDERLAHIFADSVRDDTLLCVMICDIDNFKSVNDTFSHAVGDEVLRQIARIVEQTQPKHALSARYGGEEFVIVFPGLSTDESHAVCETLRARVEAHDWASVHPNLGITLSLGLAERRAQQNHEKLLSDADTALYQAKHSGKNRVWRFTAYA